jgi:hypothetical protein
MWNRKGEEIEPPPLKLNEKEKTLLKKFLQLKLNNAWQGWKGWWMDNKRYPGLVCTFSCPSCICVRSSTSLVAKRKACLHALCSGLCDAATSVTCFCASAKGGQVETSLEGGFQVQSAD